MNLINILGTTLLKIELLEPKYFHTCSPTSLHTIFGREIDNILHVERVTLAKFIKIPLPKVPGLVTHAFNT